jgi:hypothetical protein
LPLSCGCFKQFKNSVFILAKRVHQQYSP